MTQQADRLAKLARSKIAMSRRPAPAGILLALLLGGDVVCGPMPLRPDLLRDFWE